MKYIQFNNVTMNEHITMRKDIHLHKAFSLYAEYKDRCFAVRGPVDSGIPLSRRPWLSGLWSPYVDEAANLRWLFVS